MQQSNVDFINNDAKDFSSRQREMFTITPHKQSKKREWKKEQVWDPFPITHETTHQSITYPCFHTYFDLCFSFFWCVAWYIDGHVACVGKRAGHSGMSWLPMSYQLYNANRIYCRYAIYYIYIYKYIYTYMYIYIYVYIYICILYKWISIYLPVYLSIHLPICYLPICLSTYLSIYLSIYLYIFLFIYLCTQW